MILPLFIPIAVPLNFNRHYLVISNQLILNCSCICIFISCIAVFSNFLDYLVAGFDDGLTGPSLMYLFFSGLILFSFINIVGVFREKPSVHYFSFGLWLLLVIYWFAVVALLYCDWDMVPDLCINHRCPDSFWLNDWYYLSRTKVDPNSTGPATINETVVHLERVNVWEVDLQPLANTTTHDQMYQMDLWFSLGSVGICFSFILYLALLGSQTWNHCNALCAINRPPRPVTPGGFLYIVELRRRSLAEEAGESPPPATET